MNVTQIIWFVASFGALTNVFFYMYRYKKSKLRVNYLMVIGWSFIFILFLYSAFAWS